MKLTKKKEEREMKTPLISLNKYFNFYKKKKPIKGKEKKKKKKYKISI